MFKVMAALAALLVVLPAAAQVLVTPYNGVGGVSGTLTTAGDTIPIAISGSQWATAQWSIIGTAGTANVAADFSNDGGTNWIVAPYSKRMSTVSANPGISGLGAPLATGNVWETPLPASATNFRVRCSSSGTTTTIQVSGGASYVPNAPVVAVLYDAAVTAGANNNTPNIDVTGWRQVTVTMVISSAATGVAALNIVDDGGGLIAIGSSASIAIGTYSFGWGDAGSFGTANPFTLVGGVTALPLDRRFSVTVTGATTSATRVRVVARR